VKVDPVKSEHGAFKTEALLGGYTEAGLRIDALHRAMDGEYAGLGHTWIRYLDGKALKGFDQAKAERNR